MRITTVCSLLLLGLVGCGEVDTPFADAGDTPGVDGDADPPDTLLLATPPALDASATATFELASDPPGAAFECQLDDAPPAVCTSPYEVADLADGAHTLTITAIVGELRDPTPATHTWTVDATPPALAFTAAPAPYEAATSASFVIAADEAATLACAVDGADPAPCTSPYELADLADGAHRVEVVARDAAGNTADGIAHDWVVDTVRPTVAVLSGPAPGQVVATPTFTFTWTTEDASPLVTECRLFVTGSIAPAFAPCASPQPYAPPYGALTGYTWQLRATDAAGNERLVTRTFSHGEPAG